MARRNRNRAGAKKGPNQGPKPMNKDQKQDKQLKELKREVNTLKGVNPREEKQYQLQYQLIQTPGASDNLVNLINYDNAINYTLSDVVSQTVYNIHTRIHVRGNQAGQTQNDTHRPIRIVFFMWKCDVEQGAISGANVVEPTLSELFDSSTTLSDTNLAMSRMSYTNRSRIKILKDYCFSITNHSGEENDKILRFSHYFKAGKVFPNVSKNEDLIRKASFWMPYVMVIDPLSTDRAKWSMINQVNVSTEK